MSLGGMITVWTTWNRINNLSSGDKRANDSSEPKLHALVENVYKWMELMLIPRFQFWLKVVHFLMHQLLHHWIKFPGAYYTVCLLFFSCSFHCIITERTCAGSEWSILTMNVCMCHLVSFQPATHVLLAKRNVQHQGMSVWGLRGWQSYVWSWTMSAVNTLISQPNILQVTKSWASWHLHNSDSQKRGLATCIHIVWGTVWICIPPWHYTIIHYTISS